MTQQVCLPYRIAPAAEPFLKWAGGKRQLLPELLARSPSNFRGYFEPFLGAGALYFALHPKTAVLADANERLIRTYRGVRDSPEEVIGGLTDLPNAKDFFLKQRARAIDSGSDAEVAIWMLYVNRTAFNGLYRVNRQGRFNVPFGNYSNPKLCDPARIRACSEALRNVDLRVADFEQTVADATTGDFVYFDPPYVAASRYSDFSRYTPGGFAAADQVRLRDVALSLKTRGVHVLISNSATSTVERLYASGFTVRTVSASRFINARGNGRGPVGELLIS